MISVPPRPTSRRWRTWVACLLFVLGVAAVAAAYLLLPGCSCNGGESHCLASASTTPAVRLLLIRHAQSQNNAAWYRKLFLSIRDPALTPRGRDQARRASAALAEWQPDLVFSSTLLRAQQTAALVFPGAPVLVAPHISELGLGCVWSPGACPLPRLEQAAELEAAGEQASRIDWTMLDGSAEPLGPSSWALFYRWLAEQPAVRDLVAARGEGATVAVVSHGNFLQHNVLPCDTGHPHNVQAFAARLPMLDPRAAPTAEADARLRSVEVVWEGG